MLAGRQSGFPAVVRLPGRGSDLGRLWVRLFRSPQSSPVIVCCSRFLHLSCFGDPLLGAALWCRFPRLILVRCQWLVSICCPGCEAGFHATIIRESGARGERGPNSDIRIRPRCSAVLLGCCPFHTARLPPWQLYVSLKYQLEPIILQESCLRTYRFLETGPSFADTASGVFSPPSGP
jgi:hypothetical protein